jgi:hypothetical protein
MNKAGIRNRGDKGTKTKTGPSLRLKDGYGQDDGLAFVRVFA